jgi:DNA-binding XRE family transcriptional regulator
MRKNVRKEQIDDASTEPEKLTPAEQFGHNSRAARERAGFSQEQLGTATGLHRTEISLIERGRREPRIWTAIRIARVVGVDLGELCGGIAYEVPSLDDLAERIEFLSVLRREEEELRRRGVATIKRRGPRDEDEPIRAALVA